MQNKLKEWDLFKTQHINDCSECRVKYAKLAIILKQNMILFKDLRFCAFLFRKATICYAIHSELFKSCIYLSLIADPL
jgi:hypothetical protein